MMTVSQALEAFISGLELSEAEQRNAQNQQNVVRDNLRGRLFLEEDFLSGSYARQTAIRPLHDIDLFIVLDTDKHAALKAGAPDACLKAVRKALADAYPNKDLPILQNRSVHIMFSGTGIGYDVVPAFRDGHAGNYEIPDRGSNRWIKSNPRIHKELSTQANDNAGKKLKPLIKALKHWNVRAGKPVRSFHLEVMACHALTLPPVNYLEGLHTLLTELARRVDLSCPEPAGLGPDLDRDMTAGERQNARELFGSAAKKVARAIEHARDGRTANAHYLLRALFGLEYPEEGQPETSSIAPAIVTGGSVDSGKHRYG